MPTQVVLGSKSEQQQAHITAAAGHQIAADEFADDAMGENMSEMPRMGVGPFVRGIIAVAGRISPDKGCGTRSAGAL